MPHYLPDFFLRPFQLGTIFFLLAPNSAIAQKWDEAISEGQSIIQDLMGESNYPGLSISVGIDGKIVWSEGFGYANLESQTKIDPANSKFRIGSVSKPLTAFAVGKLVEEGKLDLDASIQRYVPDFPEKRWTFTVRQVAGHLAGIRHYEDFDIEGYRTKHYSTVTESLDTFKDDPLLHKPGSEYSYSSYGWNLMSATVEAASGEEFLHYMDTYVFTPLQMSQTMADQAQEVIPGRVTFYDMVEGKPTVSPYADNSYKWAGGGFLSTTEDLIRFAFAHTTPTELKPETVDLLWTQLETTSGKGTNYGIGWGVYFDGGGNRFVGHNGGSVGGSTYFIVHPQLNMAMAVAINVSHADPKDMIRKIGIPFAKAIREAGN